MSHRRELRNLSLIGFMGTGKSTVGQQVAALLHFQFVDTDVLIEERAGKPIPRIFAENGEPTFRQLECDVVNQLADQSSLVIATGGGLACNPVNLDSLKQHSLVVCLWAAPETIWRRVRNQTHRPLLQDADPEAKIHRLLAEREPHYRNADVLLSTEFRSAREVAHQICHQFQMARRDFGSL
jgi:shikimate kinase